MSLNSASPPNNACGNAVIQLALYTVIEALMPVTNLIISSTRNRAVMTEPHKALRVAILIAYREAEYRKAAVAAEPTGIRPKRLLGRAWRLRLWLPQVIRLS